MRPRAALLALIMLTAITLPSIAQASHYRRTPAVVQPDSAVTPGDVRADATAAQVCSVSTDSFRVTLTVALKDSVLAFYPPEAGVAVQWDHYIPLALGGTTTVTNIWRQPLAPTPGAYEKDRLEVWLWRQVCAGRLSLASAQSAFRGGNWYGAYLAWRADSAPKIGTGGIVRP